MAKEFGTSLGIALVEAQTAKSPNREAETKSTIKVKPKVKPVEPVPEEEVASVESPPMPDSIVDTTVTPVFASEGVQVQEGPKPAAVSVPWLSRIGRLFVPASRSTTETMAALLDTATMKVGSSVLVSGDHVAAAGGALASFISGVLLRTLPLMLALLFVPEVFGVALFWLTASVYVVLAVVTWSEKRDLFYAKLVTYLTVKLAEAADEVKAAAVKSFEQDGQLSSELGMSDGSLRRRVLGEFVFHICMLCFAVPCAINMMVLLVTGDPSVMQMVALFIGSTASVWGWLSMQLVYWRERLWYRWFNRIQAAEKAAHHLTTPRTGVSS